MITDSIVNEGDYKDCGGQTLTTLNFRLQSADGKLVPLKDGFVSLSVIFNYADVEE